MKWLSILLPWIAGCTFNAVDVFVSVFPDGSGDVRIYRFRPADEASKDLEGIEGIKDQKSLTFTFESHEADFDQISRLDIYGIRFSFQPRALANVETGFEAVVQIPTTAQAAWYKKLGLTEPQIAAVEGLVDKPKDQLKESEIPSVVFHIVMPGAIEKNQLQGLELPKGWALKSEHPTFKTKDPVVAVLVIPLRDIMKGQIKEVTWRVSSGLVVPEVKEKWEERKAKRDK